MTAERTTARLDMHGQRHEAPCAQGPHLAYLSADRRFARLTGPGQRVLDGVLAVFALGGVPVYRAHQINDWLPIETCGLDPQLVAPPL